MKNSERNCIVAMAKAILAIREDSEADDLSEIKAIIDQNIRLNGGEPGQYHIEPE